jgi:hypothetical protein
MSDWEAAVVENKLDVNSKTHGRGRPVAWLFFNLCWWLVMTMLSYVYLDISEPLFRHISPWYLWLLVTAGLYLLFQAIFFWTILRTVFHRRNILVLVIAMSFMVLAGLLSMLTISILMGFPALKT